MIVDGSWCCTPIWSKTLRKPMLFLHIQQWSLPLSEMFSVNWFINFCRMGNLQETPMFLVKSCVIHCFRLRFSHLNQSIDQLGTVSISKSEFIFSRWLGRFLASLGRRTGSMFWGELISLSENIWKQKTFPGAKSFESEAFDSVWLRLTLLRDYSIGECDPTWHNM